MFVMFIVVVVLLLCDAIMLVMERCCERLNKTRSARVNECPEVEVGWLVGWWFSYPPTNEQSQQSAQHYSSLIRKNQSVSQSVRVRINNNNEAVGNYCICLVCYMFFSSWDPTKVFFFIFQRMLSIEWMIQYNTSKQSATSTM